MEKGTILIATDPCEQLDGVGCALIVGKEYEVLAVTENGLVVTSELYAEHWFDLYPGDAECYLNWFKVKSSAQQTAVEWLVDELTENGIQHLDMADDIIQQAKEMEKEQIVDAYCESRMRVIEKNIITAEQYYTKTYGG